MSLSEREAKSILDAAHRAWTMRDIDSTLDQYSDKLTYVCNTGGLDGGPLEVRGRSQFRDFLNPVLDTLRSVSTVSEFRFDGVQARALIKCVLLHRQTGLVLTGTYKQIANFERGRIVRMEEIHDAARMSAFWNLVLSEEDEPRLAIFKESAEGAARVSWRDQLPASFRSNLLS